MAYRYIGNKARLADQLVEMIARVVPSGGRVADLMCGTASLSQALRMRGFSVFASDIMTYAYFHATVRLRLDRPPPFAALGIPYGQALSHLNDLQPTEGYLFREFGSEGAPSAGCPPRQYFSPENAGRLDAVLATLEQWESKNLVSGHERALLRHDLIMAANRVANIAGTYGHYWSKWTRASQQPLVLTPSQFVAGSTDHTVTQGPAEEVAASVSCDLCYLDPPYTKRQYAANYHLIETLARGDQPEAVGVSGLRPWRDQYSDFCSKVRLRDAFRAILNSADCPLFMVSYSEDGLLSRDEMGELLAEFGQVTCSQIAFTRFRSNQSALAPELMEYVFLLDRLGAVGSFTTEDVTPVRSAVGQEALFTA